MAPSTLNIFYGLSLGLFGAAELRSLAAVGLQATDASAFTSCATSVAALFAMLLLEMVEKRRLLKEQYLVRPLPPSRRKCIAHGSAPCRRQTAPRVSTSSFAIKPFFLHLFPLLWLGRKRQISISDLGTVPPHLLAAPTRAKLEAAIASAPREGAFLFRASVKAFGKSFGSPIIPRAVLLLSTFGQVFLVQDLTRFITEPEAPIERGWAIVGGYIIIYVSIAMSTYLLWEKVFNVTVQYRSACSPLNAEKDNDSL